MEGSAIMIEATSGVCLVIAPAPLTQNATVIVAALHYGPLRLHFRRSFLSQHTDKSKSKGKDTNSFKLSKMQSDSQRGHCQDLWEVGIKNSVQSQVTPKRTKLRSSRLLL